MTLPIISSLCTKLPSGFIGIKMPLFWVFTVSTSDFVTTVESKPFNVLYLIILLLLINEMMPSNTSDEVVLLIFVLLGQATE